MASRVGIAQNRWVRSLGVALVLYVLSYIDRSNIALAFPPLMAKIAVHEDAAVEARYPAEIVMRVEATGLDGSRHVIEIADPRGDNRNPMDDAEIDAKFRSLASPVLGDARSAAALAAWRRIETAPDLQPLLDLLTYGATETSA